MGFILGTIIGIDWVVVVVVVVADDNDDDDYDDTVSKHQFL